MSVQFGRWNFEGQPPASDYIEKVSATLAPYGPDSDEAYSKGGVKILYHAFHTTKESRRETQPHISPSGAVITWDGRLDNRTELISDFRDAATSDSTDVALVSAAYEKWSTNCFDQLVGDWALSIWNPNNRSLILAKDPIGTRHLYYSIDKDHITWSTVLDPLVLFAGKSFTLSEEYIAGWFATMFPAAHLTPYVGVHAVPPSSSVLLRPGKRTISKYWDFDPCRKIRYSADADYEEHFRTVFAKAVQRRLRSDRPILVELSGGMDSSSIVCMADTVIARGTAETPRLDTISWYNDSDPNADERSYFTKVEEKRGRIGYHIDLASLTDVESQKSFRGDFDSDHFAATPNSSGRLAEHFGRYATYMRAQGHRVVLSGIGGGEVMGGSVPSPSPEFQNLLARGRFFSLANQLNSWAVKMRKPQLPLLWNAVRDFLPFSDGDADKAVAGLWLHPGFVRRNYFALAGYPSRVKLFGPLPSFQDNIRTLTGDRRLLAYFGLQAEFLREMCYPYLDRGLLEFMFAIPREQIVRVGQRRSLMKRALVGIVPDELLKRKRKASVPAEPPKGSPKQPSLIDIGQHIVSSSLGIIDPNRLWEALQKGRHGKEVPVGHLKRTLTLEYWLRHLMDQGVLTNSISATEAEVLLGF
jgi:asparagine synthase (glutamine-hydrolysing)